MSLSPLCWFIVFAESKKGELGFREQWEDGECDKEQWGETEDSYVLWMRSSGWLWRRSPTPPSAPHATPLSPHSSSQQMMHNGFLCFNGPDSHTGSFLRVHIAACIQVLSVKKPRGLQLIFTLCIYHLVNNLTWMYHFIKLLHTAGGIPDTISYII